MKRMILQLGLKRIWILWNLCWVTGYPLQKENIKLKIVIIENQLEKSNHDHLGKLITYLSAVGADCAIWIVSEPRSEHVKAVAWLNESTSTDFYLIKIEAIKIGDSLPAPLFTVIVGPSEEAREVGEAKKEMKERHVLRKQFWTTLLERARDKTTLHSNITRS